MKKYLTILFFFAITSGAHAQLDLKVYSVPCLMPDGTIQTILLNTNESGLEKFKSIALENAFNMAPVSLQKKIIPSGTKLVYAELPSVSESRAYRFLANQLCERCTVAKTISKTFGGMMFLNDSSSNDKNLLLIKWIPEVQQWCLTFIPTIDPFGNIVSIGRPIFN